MGETEKQRRRRHRAQPEVDYGPTPGVADDSPPRDQSSGDAGHVDMPHHDVSDHNDAFHLAFGHALGALGSFSEAFGHFFDALGNFLANLPEHPD